MPQLGNFLAPGLVEVNQQQAAMIVEQSRRNSQAADEPDAIVERSKELQVYIYSVGAWPHTVTGGSLGMRFIDCIPEDKVLDGSLTVSEPTIIAGIPSETYPGDGEGRRIYHNPRKASPDRKHPGMHLAKELIGEGDQADKGASLANYGVFISTQPEQKKPGKNASAEDVKAFEKWEADVHKAQKRLRGKLADMCSIANQHHSRGEFALVKDDKYYLAAKVLKKTEIDCPWLKDTESGSDKRNCIAECGAILPTGSLKCGQCGVLQVSEEKYKAEIARRQSLN